MTSPTIKPRHAIVLGLGLVLIHMLLTILTWDNTGFVKDEGYYFSASHDNVRWYYDLFSGETSKGTLRALTDEGIDRRWNNNHEHPPFCKTVMGLNHSLWHDTLHWVKYGNSHRMATLLWTSILVFFLFWYARTLVGAGWSAGAVLIYITMPRVFFHNHLATFDMPVVTMWFVTVLAFRQGLKSPRWAVLTSILLGVGLATKNNAYFLPVVFALLFPFTPHWKKLLSELRHPIVTVGRIQSMDWGLLAGILIFPLMVLLRRPDQAGFAAFILVSLLAVWLIYLTLRKTKPLPLRWALIALPSLVSPLTFFLLWPWIWHDTLPRLAEYFNRHLNPPAWETHYLGNLILNPPPFPVDYPFVMWLYTLPVSVVFLGLLGFAMLLWRSRFGQVVKGFVLKASGEKRWKHPGDAWNGSLESIPSRFDNWLLIVNILLPLAIIANPKTPVYGGTKHFMTAVPYLCIACVMALRFIAQRFSSHAWFQSRAGLTRMLSPALILLAMLPGVFGLLICQGNELSYYNEIMGGPTRSPEVGMQRSFWAAGSRLILPELNKLKRHGQRVYYNNTPYDSQRAYKWVGEMDQGFHPARDEWRADLAVLNTWQFKLEKIYEVRRAFGTNAPSAVGDLLGVPLVEVYVNQNQNLPKNKAITLPYLLQPSQTYR